MERELAKAKQSNEGERRYKVLYVRNAVPVRYLFT